MEKYLVIFIIIITLYYIQKYCIQSEVDKFLITKNIVENFSSTTTINFDDQAAFNILSDIEADLFKNNSLNILGNIIINNKHKLISDGDTLKIRDLTDQNFLNLVVKNMDVGGILTVKGTSNLNNAVFTNSTNSKELRINGPNISSINSDLLLSSSTNNIKLGNTEFSGNLSFNNDKKPIISKVIIINNASSANINTEVNYEEYSGVSFSGYDHSNNKTVASNLQINTIRDLNTKNWFIFFNQPLTNLPAGNIKIRLTFFHSNFVQNCSENNIPTIYQSYCI
jgi:hypothetical protein